MRLQKQTNYSYIHSISLIHLLIRSFNGTMKSLGSLSFNTKLSSAGLVYLHMGKEVLAEVTETSIDDPSLPRLYEKVYEKFIEEIDAIDNGIDQYDGMPRYDPPFSFTKCIFFFLLICNGITISLKIVKRKDDFIQKF